MHEYVAHIIFLWTEYNISTFNQFWETILKDYTLATQQNGF